MLLITGGTGLLGGHVLYALLQKYDRVAALIRPSGRKDNLREIFSFYTPDPEPLLERIDWRSGDLLDKESLVKAIEGVSLIINCAAIVSFNPADRKRLIANNVEGTRNLAEVLLAASQRKGPDGLGSAPRSLIHVSSTSALGDGPGNDPAFLIDEDTPRNPIVCHTGYSVSKFESESLLLDMGVRAVILNPGIILGPGQWEKGSSQLFVKAWHGLKFYPYGGTGYVDVRDVGDIILRICSLLSGNNLQEFKSYNINDLQSSSVPFLHSSLPGERFCLVGANLRYRDFFNLVTDEYGKPNPDIYAGKFLSELAWRAEALRALITGEKPLLTSETAKSAQRINYYSSEKIRKILDYQFRPAEETIEWVAGCYRRKIET